MSVSSDRLLSTDCVSGKLASVTVFSILENRRASSLCVRTLPYFHEEIATNAEAIVATAISGAMIFIRRLDAVSTVIDQHEMRKGQEVAPPR